MSNRPYNKPNPVIVDGDMSAQIISAPTILAQKTVGSYSFSWSGASPIGVIEFQASNDYTVDTEGHMSNPGHWVTMDVVYNGSIVNSVPVSGNTGAGLIDWSTGAMNIRTVYVPTSGSGLLQSLIVCKVA